MPVSGRGLAGWQEQTYDPDRGPVFPDYSAAPLAACAGDLGFRPGLPAAGLLIALGPGPTAVAYTLYFRGLRTTAARIAVLLMTGGWRDDASHPAAAAAVGLLTELYRGR